MDATAFNALFREDLALPLGVHGVSSHGRGHTLRYRSGTNDLGLIRLGGRLDNLLQFFRTRILTWAATHTSERDLDRIRTHAEGASYEKCWIEDCERFVSEALRPD